LRADFPVVQAIVLIVSLLYVALVFFADLINAGIDPRLRLS
jgi:peptide/nickel transport system permease protein